MNALLVRKFLIPAHERLLGRRTQAYLRDLVASQWLEVDELREIQTIKLRRLLSHAVQNCPFYAETIGRAKISVKHLTLADIERLPTLTKQDIRREFDRLVESPRRRPLFQYSTGGSSGDPLSFLIDRDRQAADQAARARSRRWFAIEQGERELYLWGAPVELAAQDRIKSIRDRMTNQLLLSAFRMTPERMSDYLGRWRRFDPVHVFGYPSSLARLLSYACELGVSMRGNSLRAAFVTGELLTTQDRQVIESSLGVPVADGYGSREAGFIAHQCPEGRYHVTMESLVVELLDETQKPVKAGEPGEVVVTHLDAYGMPFIRYRTGDVARRAQAPCPCGRGLDVLDRIEGRRTDMLRTADGGYSHALSVIYELREAPGIRQFRIEQAPDRHLRVEVVSDPSFNDAARLRVLTGLKQRMGEGIAIELVCVDEIPPAPSGKHRCVISHA